MVTTIKKPVNSRIKFLSKLVNLEKEEPFTQGEREKYTFQQRNFIRGIQIAKNCKKEDGIKEFKRIQGKKALIKKQGDDIQAMYDGRKAFKTRAPKARVCKPIKTTGKKEKKTYIYKGITKRADKVLIDRFVRDTKSSPSSRRYIDRLSGESISRRERDKRIAYELSD